MEKADVKSHEAQSDTSSVINMKEYAPSEYPTSEAPPAYMKPRGSALRIARLAAFTIITSAVILGAFILAASWIQANTARNLDLTLNQELMDDLHPNYEHLVANDNLANTQDNQINDDAKEQQQEVQSSNKDEEQQIPQQAANLNQEGKSMELDEIANVLMQKGVRGNVNCIVEKRRNEELVDHAPRNVALPFGLNITTPPRLQHLTGEQIVIICKDDNEEKESEEKQEEPMQPVLVPLPQQLLNQFQQLPQVIPLSQVLQQLPQPQQQQQLQPQQQQQQQPFFIPQHQQIHLQQQELPQQIVYQHAPQMHPQQHQIFYPQPPQQQSFVRPPLMQQPQEQQQVFFRPPVPLRDVPLNQEQIPMNHMMHHRMPINPLAVQDVPMSQMPFTHMPMREQQPVPVHHLVPPRPQNFQNENFNQEEKESMPEFRGREMNFFRGREMPEARAPPQPMPQYLKRDFPRQLPMMGREPRLMRLPFSPIADNALPEAPRPASRIRFPDSDSESGPVAQITRIIPIRLEKDESSQEEKRPLPIPIKAILDMVFSGMRPLQGRQSFPVPIDIKIERIENKPAPENSSESQESHEEDMENEPSNGMMMEDEQEESSEPSQTTKLQQVEIVEKEGDDTHAIPIPADAQEAQVFKLENKPEQFLPNGQGRGGAVFPIPQIVRDAQIFTVSDARANMPQPEGEVKLMPLPVNGEQRSVRLYPVVEEEAQQQPEQPEQEQAQQPEQQMQQSEEQSDLPPPHFVMPRSV